MSRYLLSRIGQAVLVLWAAFTVTFVILYLLPGDPLVTSLYAKTEGAVIDPQKLAALRAEYGFDKPVIVQYLDRLRSFALLDFGRSISTGADIGASLSSALLQTVYLTLAAMTLALLLGVTLAVAANWTSSRLLASTLLALPSVGASIPTFWTGLLLIQTVAFDWHLLPATGNRGFSSLVLPAIALAIPSAAYIGQVLARSLRRIMAEPFMEAVRARGVGAGRLWLSHALRNALAPTLNLFGIITGQMLAGAVVTETVFSRSGLGRMMQQAVELRDTPVVLALVVVAAGLFVFVNVIVDVACIAIDPRDRPWRSTRSIKNPAGTGTDDLVSERI